MYRWLLLFLLISPVTLADVVLCTGMSNANQECDHWIENNATGHHIINGAVSGFDIVKVYNQSEDYWATVMQRIARAGLSPADIDIIWNKNAIRTGPGKDLIIQRQRVHDYFIWFQAVSESLFPNLKAGYHSTRTSGKYCSLNPEPFAGDTRNAIVGIGDSSGAVTHFEKWHLGPDLGSVEYVMADFRDGCHPSESGLQKTTAIINAFFNGDPGPGPEPGSQPVVEYLGNTRFQVNWEGAGSVLACSGIEFAVSGNSKLLSLPRDLPIGPNHQCQLDQGDPSNRFGCRTRDRCKAF